PGEWSAGRSVRVGDVSLSRRRTSARRVDVYSSHRAADADISPGARYDRRSLAAFDLHRRHGPGTHGRVQRLLAGRRDARTVAIARSDPQRHVRRRHDEHATGDIGTNLDPRRVARYVRTVSSM